MKYSVSSRIRGHFGTSIEISPIGTLVRQRHVREESNSHPPLSNVEFRVIDAQSRVPFVERMAEV